MIHELRVQESRVGGVRRVELRHVRDAVRGDLAVVEFERVLPFQPKRCFWTYAIPGRNTRGEHAHRVCSQFLICAHGACRLRVDDGRRSEDFMLESPHVGVLVPPMVCAVEHEHTTDSVLMVLASHLYDPDDYIRDYAEFLNALEHPFRQS